MQQQQQEPTVIFTAAPPGQPQAVMQPAAHERLYLRRSHMKLGIIQMVIGSLVFVLEVVGLTVDHVYTLLGSGIYTGVIFVVAGLLGYLAYRKDSRGLVVACMVMNIIASCVAVIGLSFSAVENVMTQSYIRHSRYRNRNGNSYKRPLGFAYYQLVKEAVVIIACVFELVVAIVHASFTCATLCRCCRECCRIDQQPAHRPCSDPTVVHYIQQPGHFAAPGAQPGPQQVVVQVAPAAQQMPSSDRAAPLPRKGQQPALTCGETSGQAWGGSSSSLPPAYTEMAGQE